MEKKTKDPKKMDFTVDPVTGRVGSVAEVSESGVVKMHTTKVASCYVGPEKVEVENRSTQLGLRTDAVDAFEKNFEQMAENEKVAAILQAMRG